MVYHRGGSGIQKMVRPGSGCGHPVMEEKKEEKKGRKKEGKKKEKRRSQQNVRHFIVQFF